MTDAMRWRIFDAKGELIGAVRYASDALRLAISAGADSKLFFEERPMPTISEGADLDVLSISDQLISAAYNRRRTAA